MDLGLERAGMKIAWQVEIDEFCLKVLKKHWPEVPKYGDIRKIDPRELEPVDLVCGGFPCQPFSAAGKRRGKEDDRYLWPEMFRVIKEIRPRWVLGENVAGIVNLALDTVLSDLESEGYQTAAFIIPACAVGASHRRDRAWIIASKENVADTESTERQRAGNTRKGWNGLADGGGRYAQSGVCGVSDGLSGWLDGHRWPAPFGCEQYDWEPQRLAKGMPGRVQRLLALGNAVVPQIVEVIGRAIMEVEGGLLNVLRHVDKRV